MYHHEKKPKEDRTIRKVEKIICTLPKQGRQEISSDISGSYTGTPMDSIIPVQDADDL